MDESIFKKYDIRGVYPKQIDEEAVYRICFAFLEFVKEYYKSENPKIIIGRDIRESSESLKEAGIKALVEGGAEVVDIGLCSTPLNYFANWYLKADGSVMITASHNPKEYNGLKFSLKEVVALAEVGGIDEVKNLALKGKFRRIEGGSVRGLDISGEYINYIAKDVGDIKIAVDCGNGMSGPLFKKMADKINLNYKGLYLEPDGEFPNHAPNPLDNESLKDLQGLMEREKFDLGVAFDGDGDRLRILTKNGEPVKSDSIIGIFAQAYLHKNNKIVCDARISRGVAEEIEKLGGEILKSPVGYPNIRRLMRKNKCFFGGELALHYFWQDFSYSESALLTLIRLLRILKEEDIEELKKPFEKYFSSGEINFKGIEDKEGTISRVGKKYSDGELSRLDGLTVEYPDWWFNLRPSNTEPLLRLLVEAESRDLLEQKVKELTGTINEARPR